LERNVYRIENNRQRRNELQEQREVAADALRNVVRELRKLEKMEDNHDGGSGRAG
jgi:hypothetical protein